MPGKRCLLLLLSPMLSVLLIACESKISSKTGAALQDNILIFTDQPIATGLLQRLVDEHEANPDMPLDGAILGEGIAIVRLSGKTNHFGRNIEVSPPEYIDYHATVPGTKVWIAEYPATRDLDIQTDHSGWWTMYVVKDRGKNLEFSFVFEKFDWITTKTNVNIIKDVDNTDFAIQFIDPLYYRNAMLPFVEDMMRQNGYPNFFLENAMVVTVGKSWASMHDDRLPHGDPGATMTLTPQSDVYIGPIYFNEAVIPDLDQPNTSVDGGVTWLNMPLDTTYLVSAQKDDVDYPTIRFRVSEADKEAGVTLYIASPPDSLEGDNDSAPGEN